MRKRGGRVLPMIVGVSVISTLVANGAVLVARVDAKHAPKSQVQKADLVAAASRTDLTPDAVAPLKQRVTPDLLVAQAGTISPDVLDKLRKTKGVRNIEVIDAVQATVNGKIIGLIGVNPSTFRAYTPKPTAQSDALWRNIASGDIAVSFSFGNDGGVPLGSQVPIVGRTRQMQARVGAFATMGISDIDGVVSHATAQTLGMPSGNAVLVSAPKTSIPKIDKLLKKSVLPKGAKTLELHPKLDYGQLPTASGTYMTAQQITTAIAAAESKIGLPYIWGGTGPRGYDCSGLVQFALGVAGIRMPRVAADQARTGIVLPYSQARVGDLLIWANDPTNPGYIDHIAIYIGNGKMVVAPHTGDYVKIANVYTSTLQGVVRVNPRLAARVAG